MSNGRKTGVGAGLGALRVILNAGLSYVTPRASVRRLLSDLGRSDEDTSMAAYMALVKLGPRIRSYLVEGARKGIHTTAILRVLGDQGDKGAVAALREFLHAADPRVASAAKESLEVLQEEGNDKK